MKRPFSLLSLPIILGVLLLVLNWRMNYSMPTRKDMVIRNILSKSYEREVEICYPGKTDRCFIILSKEEFKPFIDSLYLSQEKSESDNLKIINSQGALINVNSFVGSVDNNGTNGLGISIAYKERIGMVNLNYNLLNLHPKTTKRWIELLRSNPRFGSRVRAFLK